MEKERKHNKVILILLLILILGLSIGFAAFASRLKIQSSATVSPDANLFKVAFSSKSNVPEEGNIVLGGKATGGVFEKNATILSSLNANFTAPGQIATWKFYAYNSGEYDAFLNSVTLGAIVCTPDGADPAKVIEAARGIDINISVGGQTYTSTTEGINSHILQKGKGEEIIVTLTYADGSAIVDGKFNVNIGDIILEYNSAD